MSSLPDTSRFLMQATLGFDKALLNRVAQQGIEPWLQQQLNAPLTRKNVFKRSTAQIWQHFRRELLAVHGEMAINGDGNNPALPYKWYFHMAWWQHALGDSEHLLRQRVAQALSEILVISDNSSLELDAIGMASYYDLLYQHAFGHYTDLLYDVSMHPCMGVYLSHMNNQKADKAKHIHPDENYAREIMQLFTIGLYQLNGDGSRKRGANSQFIPSYDNRDIKALARVFTGLKAHSYQYEWNTSFWQSDYNGYPVGFTDGIEKTYKTVPFVNMTKPMEVEEAFHDRSAKTLLNGHIKLRGNQTAKQEIRHVVERLVAHPNTAPFVARHLINQLVTSNPSPRYVRAVAEKFGKTGNLKAAVQTILTYPLKNPVAKVMLPSARRVGKQSVQSQKLKSPLLRATQVLRAFKVKNQSQRYWLVGDDIQELLSQHPVSSPTVFNFYKPDFMPHGGLTTHKLVAPEFELHTSATAISYANMMYYWFFGNYCPAVSTAISQTEKNVAELDIDTLQANKANRLSLDFSDFLQQAKTISQHDALIDDMSLLLTGKTNLLIKPRIKAAFKPYRDNPEWVVQTIAFMLTISPEFTVQEA